MKPTPVVDGDVAYILGWAGGADQGSQENIPSLVDILKDHDVNKDGKLAVSEAPLRYRSPVRWGASWPHPISTTTVFMTSASGTNLSKSDRRSIR